MPKNLYESRAECHVMFTRKCPSETQCAPNECARFDLEDEEPWLELFAREEAEKNDG